MNDDSKDIKKGSQCDHVSAQKPSLTAKKKSIDASVTFSGEAKEEERARDLDPSHSVEQSSVKTLHLSGFDEVKLDQLPESLLISMMAFLPLRAVSDLRLLTVSFGEAGKQTIHLKLQHAGIAGKSFDETTKNAMLFEKQACTQKKRNQALIARVQNMLDKNISKSTMLDVTYLPMRTSHQYPRLKNILENSAALDRHKYQLIDRFSRTQFIGLKLINAPLKVKVSAQQYREELQKQKDGLSQLGLYASTHENLLKELDQGIKNMEKHEPDSHLKMLAVFYLPNISNLPQPSGKMVQRSAYEKFMQEVGESIASKYAVKIPGIGVDKGHQTGIDVSNTSIILKAPASQLMSGAHASNLLIDEQVSVNRKKLYEL